MKFSLAATKLPNLSNALLAIFAAILLTLAFPNFDLWFFAWFALVPLFYAIDREKESWIKSFILGWLFGTTFFSASCWWLTYSFTHYGGIPSWLAFILLSIITGIVGIFPAIFASAFSIILKRFGTIGIFAAPVLWTAQEFLRATLADTSWNAIAYSQAFHPFFIKFASFGGIYLVGFIVCYVNCLLFSLIYWQNLTQQDFEDANKEFQSVQRMSDNQYRKYAFGAWKQIASTAALIIIFLIINNLAENKSAEKSFSPTSNSSFVVVVQANVPMSGLNQSKWEQLRQRHVELAEQEIGKLQRTNNQPITVVFPESPMNFAYSDDPDFRRFIGNFARKHNAFVLFNSAEPNLAGQNYFNSAVMINPRGEKIGQYDKIHLVPFGEFAPVPSPIKPLIPTLVGSFQLGENYNLFPIGDAQAGIMICYESHFPSLSREFAKRGADVLIEMTNDGYLGDTGVLRQHLSGAIFRAVETNRPVLRATNVGITAYINERGEVSDAADVYTEATRTWTVAKSDGKQTFYVRFGDWFAWLCLFLSFGLLIYGLWKRRNLVTDLHE